MIRRIALAMVISYLTFALCVTNAGLRINSSPSMPTGLWWSHALGAHRLAVNDVVVVCPTTDRQHRVHGSCTDGAAPLIKPVRAVANDQVTASPGGIAINGHNVPFTAPLTTPTAPPAYPPGNYRVQPGQVWLLVERADSYDSRYYGPVELDQIIRLAYPLWVTR